MSTNERDALAFELFVGDNANQPRESSIQDWIWFKVSGKQQGQVEHYKAMAAHILTIGYRKIDHTEYALDHKLADLQFTDDDGALWTDEDDVKDYASEYGDTAPLVKRHVTAWEAAQ